MNTVFCALKAERIKLSGARFYCFHILLPVLVLFLGVGYMAITPYDVDVLVGVFMQLIGLAYPIVAAMLTNCISTQEVEAGGGFHMLTARARFVTLLAKFLYLAVFGLLSCMLVSVGFGVLTPMVRPEAILSMMQMVQAGAIVWLTAIFLYAIHLLIAFQFGSGASFMLAAVELSIGALLMTGLGDVGWLYVPCAWAPRMVSIFLHASIEGNLFARAPLRKMIAVSAGMTFVMVGLLFVWFFRWEGRKNEE